VLSGPQSYFPDGVQEDSQYMGADLDRFITSLENFKNNYVIDPSDIMGPMVDQLKERVQEFEKFHEDQPNDPINRQPPDTSDNRFIQVDSFPGPFSPPLPWSSNQRPKFRDASAPPPDITGSQPDSSAPVAYHNFRHVFSAAIQLETIFEANQRIPYRTRRLLESIAASQ
jgi:hypothetical protein